MSLLNAPCVFCGYNGAGYYQSGTHLAACPWHSVGGIVERTRQLRSLIEGHFKVVQEATAMAKEYMDREAAALGMLAEIANGGMQDPRTSAAQFCEQRNKEAEAYLKAGG